MPIVSLESYVTKCRFVRLLILACVVTTSAGSIAAQNFDVKQKLEDSARFDHIANIALRYAGFANLEGFDRGASVKEPKQEVLIEESMPFLSKRMNNKTVWKVDIAGVKLVISHPQSGATRIGTRDFSLYVDSSGMLFKIVSELHGFDKDEWRIPYSRDAEISLSRQKETYTGFVEGVPSISFLGALESLIAGDPTRADYLEAVCVMRKHQDEEPQAVWIIQMYGEGVSYGGPEHLPFYILNHLRSVVDAETGRFIVADQLPQPSHGQRQEEPLDSQRSIETPRAAWLRALEYTGFARAIDTSAVEIDDVAKRLEVTNGRNLCDHPGLQNRDVWQVVFDTVRLRLPGWSYKAIEDQIPRTFEVLLDPESGQLYQIRSIPAEGEMESDSDISLKLKHRSTLYHELLAGPPQIDFYSALEQATFADPLLAKQLVGIAVKWTDLLNEQQPVWVVIGIGTSSDPRSATEEPYSAPSAGPKGVDDWECVIDAADGRLKRATGL